MLQNVLFFAMGSLSTLAAMTIIAIRQEAKAAAIAGEINVVNKERDELLRRAQAGH